jgi:hypothetical protein
MPKKKEPTIFVPYKYSNFIFLVKKVANLFNRYYKDDYQDELNNLTELEILMIVMYLVFEIAYIYGPTKEISEPCPGINFSVSLEVKTKNNQGNYDVDKIRITLKNVAINPIRQVFLMHYNVNAQELFAEDRLAGQFLDYVLERHERLKNNNTFSPKFFNELKNDSIKWPEKDAYLASKLFYKSKPFQQRFPELYRLLAEYFAKKKAENDAKKKAENDAKKK